MKECIDCKETKSLNDFPTSSTRGYKYWRNRCKPCYRAHLKATDTEEKKARRRKTNQKLHSKYMKEDPLFKRKENWIRRGIDVVEAERVVKENNGSCDICGIIPERSLHLDHCHTTNKVRGMLCDSCNHLLGKAKDSQRVLIAAIDYLNNRN